MSPQQPILAAIGLCLLGCSTGSTPSAKQETPSTPTTPAVPTPATPPPETDMTALARSHNALGIDVWKTIEGGGNQAISPASIGLALGMTYLGARGDTAAQMVQTLHITLEPPAFTSACAGLLQAWLTPTENGPELRIANRLFVEKSLRVEQPFFDATRDGFAAPVELLDFAREPAKSRTHINDWVASQTKDRIQDLLPADGVSSDTRVVLTNAIYFKGKWSEPFQPNATMPRPFFAGGKRQVDVPTMNQVSHHRYRSLADVDVVDLDYEGSTFAMSIVLPKKRDGLAAVEKSLSAETIASWTDSTSPYARVRLELPKFKIEAPPEPLRLKDALVELGMPLAFDRDKADFTGIHAFKKPEDRLLISNVFHKTFVEVNEAGTEAAAATAVSMSRAGSAAPTDEPKPFVADHPFLFVLHDTKSGAVLFLGRVDNPK